MVQAGCFAGGTKRLTQGGYVAVEEIRVGDEVAARAEAEPQGAVAWKPVEAAFRRTGRILHLHFPDGELIRTTPEHPFSVEGPRRTRGTVNHPPSAYKSLHFHSECQIQTQAGQKAQR